MSYDAAKFTGTESRLFVITPKDKTGKKTSELRVVSWNYKTPVIEKRGYWRKTEADSWLWGKSEGWGTAEIEAVNKAWAKVAPLLELTDPNRIKEVEEARKAKIASKK